MRPEANLQHRDGRGSPVCSARAGRTPLLSPVGGWKRNQIRHHQPQQPTVRESGAGPTGPPHWSPSRLIGSHGGWRRRPPLASTPEPSLAGSGGWVNPTGDRSLMTVAREVRFGRSVSAVGLHDPCSCHARDLVCRSCVRCCRHYSVMPRSPTRDAPLASCRRAGFRRARREHQQFCPMGCREHRSPAFDDRACRMGASKETTPSNRKRIGIASAAALYTSAGRRSVLEDFLAFWQVAVPPRVSKIRKGAHLHFHRRQSLSSWTETSEALP